MANTTHGLPYPVGTDKVIDGDDAIKALAESLDPTVRTSGIVASSGWGSVSDVRLIRAGGLCIIHFQIVRTGAQIGTGSGQGANITDTAVASGIPADMIPSDRQYGVTISSSAVLAVGRIDGAAQGATAGRVVLTALPAGAIATDSGVDVDATYWIR